MRLLPKPYPEEAVGSVLLRGRIRMGLELKPFLKWVFDVPGRSSASLLLESDAARIASMCGMTGSALLERHTIFPYATAFQNGDLAAKLRMQLLSAEITKVGAVAPLVANSVHRGLRRFCPECVLEDLNSYGESYWRRSHQIATVFLCTKHETILIERSGCSPATLNTAGLTLPHSSGRTRRVRLDLPVEIARDLSTISELLLTGGQHEDGWVSDDNSSWYRQHASAKGFAYRSGAVATGPIADSLARFYGTRFLKRLDCLVNVQQGNSWPSLLLRESSYQAAAVRHVLLRCFLTGSHLDTETKAMLIQHKYSTRDYSQIDNALSKRLVAQSKKLQREGMVRTATALLEAAESLGTYRHNRHRLPKSRAVIDAFKVSAQPNARSSCRYLHSDRLGSD